MKPQSRTSGLLTRELPGELLVYDRERHTAHCLNRTAAVVFRHADGTRTLEELARLVDPEAGAAARAAASLALEQLAESGLLESAPAAVASQAVTRREVARRVGIAAAILLPAVATIVAPTPAEAAATCVTSCAGQPNGTRCDVCNSGLTCATTTAVCVSNACSDGC